MEEKMRDLLHEATKQITIHVYICTLILIIAKEGHYDHQKGNVQLDHEIEWGHKHAHYINLSLSNY